MLNNYPLSILPLFNAKTLDYLFDNQAFVGFIPPQYFGFSDKISAFLKNSSVSKQSTKKWASCLRLILKGEGFLS
jgi:hypothetical protein